MKTIIAGSRGVYDYERMKTELAKLDFKITEVVSGGCKGPDLLGERWARENRVPVKRFVPDWERHKLRAGPLRNRDMAAYAEALVAFWDGSSRGTKNMIEEARERGLRTVIIGILPG